MSLSMGSSIVRSSLCPTRLDMPVILAPSRTFRTSLVVQMGRRSAKIALRKVGVADYGDSSSTAASAKTTLLASICWQYYAILRHKSH